MEELVHAGLNALKDLGVDYGEVRAEVRTEENVSVKNREVEAVSRRDARRASASSTTRRVGAFLQTTQENGPSPRRQKQPP